VIVSTIQAFRADDTTGRKVYDGKNGNMPEHFEGKSAALLATLEQGPDGKPKNSLVNMLRMRRPIVIVIVDEAHNARTELSFAALGSVKPTCIIEFTATPSRGEVETVAGKKKPNPASNVLHRMTASELDAAQMVKLPLRVFTRHASQRDQLLTDAISLRTSLEGLAEAEGQKTGEYLRPILLLQAARVDDCEPLRERLVKEFGVAKDEVKIHAGKLSVLDGVRNINSPKCPVRFVITVEKLREGWDCPFAYVLCSLKETRSPAAIEQIVGRILRLPGVRKKQHPDLNLSYTFPVSDSMPAVLNELREALETMASPRRKRRGSSCQRKPPCRSALNRKRCALCRARRSTRPSRRRRKRRWPARCGSTWTRAKSRSLSHKRRARISWRSCISRCSSSAAKATGRKPGS
jgi:type III restriction enzyme